MRITSDTIIRAIQEAVDAADKKGIAVTVNIHQGAFFPTESNNITITAAKNTHEKPHA